MSKAIEEFLWKLIGHGIDFVGMNPISIPWSILERQGLISPLEPATEVLCPHGETSKVAWTPGKDETVPYISCPLCGVVLLSRGDIRRWKAEIVPFLNQVVEQFGIKGIQVPLVPELLWSLGWRKGEPWYFLRWCTINEVKLVKHIIDRSANAMIITGLHKTAENAELFWPARTISMDVYADLSSEGMLVLNRDMLEEHGIHFDTSRKSKNKYRQRKRTDKIELLLKELKEFVKMARSHALERSADKDFRPLQRPTLKELSQRTGISKCTISRCLNDEQASVLRVLWERLADPWEILPH